MTNYEAEAQEYESLINTPEAQAVPCGGGMAAAFGRSRSSAV